jgi:hypothetical protein
VRKHYQNLRKMKKVKLISRKNQGHYKTGDLIRIVEVEIDFDLNKIQVYYDFVVIPISVNI